MRNKVVKLALGLAVFALAASTPLAANALWSHNKSTTQAVTITDGVMMASVDNTFKSHGKGKTIDGQTFYPAIRMGIKGEKIEKDGLARWDVEVKPYNQANPAASTKMDVVVHVDPGNNWAKASFTLAKCNTNPAGLDLKPLNAKGYATLGSYTTTNRPVKTCLWARLPETSMGVFEVSGKGENASTVGKPTKADGSKTGTQYKNTVTVTGKPVGENTTVKDTDQWHTSLKRYPNPSDGEVELLFRPVETSGICVR